MTIGVTLAPVSGGQAIPVIFPDTANSQSVTTSGTAAASAVIDSSHDRIVRIVCQEDCWYALGTDPTAVADTAGSTFLPGGAVEYVGVSAGDKFSVIQDSAAGEFSITPAKVQ